MRFKNYLAMLVLTIMVIVNVSCGFVSVPLGTMEDAVFVYPPATATGMTLQSAYDYITSSDRDDKMGTLSVLNQRTLILTSGNYTSTSLVFDTDYVNIYGLGDVTITDTSGAVIDCGDKICTITNVRLDASSIANGLTNDSATRCSNVTIIDGTDEVVYLSGLAGNLVYDIGTGQLANNITYNEFDSVGIVSTKTSGGGAATGVTGAENLWLYPEGMFEYHILGTQTILQPVIATGGVNIGLDQTDNDGVEIGQGITAQSAKAFVVGTDACYLKVKFSIATVAGTDDCAVGFRKAEAYQAAIDSYDEWASLNVISGDIKIETELNGGGTTTTDTTDNWADAETHTLEVYIDIAGAVTYKIDGVAPTTTAAFSFDSTEVVVPFLYLIQANASQTGAVVLQSWECGIQQ